MKKPRLKPVHPGMVLMEDFLVPMNISQTKLASCLGVPPRRINEIVLGARGITADTALRLAKFFSTSPELWTGIQADFELDMARINLGEQLETKIPRYSPELMTMRKTTGRKTKRPGHGPVPVPRRRLVLA